MDVLPGTIFSAPFSIYDPDELYTPADGYLSRNGQQWILTAPVEMGAVFNKTKLYTAQVTIPEDADPETVWYVGIPVYLISDLSDFDWLQLGPFKVVSPYATESAQAAQSALLSQINANAGFVSKLMKGNLVTDVTANPYNMVWTDRETGAELLRKEIRDVNGNPVTSTSQIVGQLIEVPPFLPLP